jgi:hypothetical protein
VPINGCVKKCMVYIHNDIKEGKPIVLVNMDEPGGCYIKWEKPGTEIYSAWSHLHMESKNS